MNDGIFKRVVSYRVRKFGSKFYIVGPKGALEVNDPFVVVWDKLDGVKSGFAIASEVAQDFQLPEPPLSDVATVLEVLLDMGAIKQVLP